MVPREEDEWTEEERVKIQKNHKVLNILIHAIDPSEFNRVLAYKNAKEMWGIFVTTYEGTSQVRETKMSIYVHQYELFKIPFSEFIIEMQTGCTRIVDNFKSLGKHIQMKKWLRKTLRYLPRSKWGPNVMASKEGQNLKMLYSWIICLGS